MTRPMVQMLGWPLVTLVSVFLPWFRMVVPSPGPGLNMIQLSPAAWGWVVVNLACLGLWRWPGWGRRLWSLMGMAVLGGGIATGFAWETAGRVSRLLAAPTPIAPDWGLGLFLVGALGWAIVGLLWTLG